MTMKAANARPPSRMKRKTLYLIATSISMAIYIALVLFARDQHWLVWPALGFAALGVILAGFWMSALDEAAQQAHYIAWFWGGNVGLLISMVAFVTVLLRPEALEKVLSMQHPPLLLAAGIAIGIVPAVLGYVIWWAILWLRRA